GVTAQTVYRWELPANAAEARRPRGEQLARLEQYARRDRPQKPAPAESPPNELGTSATSIAPATWVDDDVSRVLPSLDGIFRAELRRAQSELMQIVAAASQLSPNARGAAYFGLGLCELLDRADARAALLAIAPLLPEAEAGRLSP